MVASADLPEVLKVRLGVRFPLATDRLYIFHIGYGHGHGIVMVIERLWFYMVI